jgi:hypothetical protein
MALLVNQYGPIKAPPTPPPERVREDPLRERIETLVGFDPFHFLEELRNAQEEVAVLRQQEAVLVAEASPFRARYTYPSLWEHERKAKLALLSERRRNEVRQEQGKITEKELDEWAHAHPEYLKMLSRAEVGRQRLEDLDASLARVRGEIETALAVVKFFELRSRLGEELVRFRSKEETP